MGHGAHGAHGAHVVEHMDHAAVGHRGHVVEEHMDLAEAERKDLGPELRMDPVGIEDSLADVSQVDTQEVGKMVLEVVRSQELGVDILAVRNLEGTSGNRCLVSQRFPCSSRPDHSVTN